MANSYEMCFICLVIKGMQVKSSLQVEIYIDTTTLKKSFALFSYKLMILLLRMYPREMCADTQ